jgi:hypothetical protein
MSETLKFLMSSANSVLCIYRRATSAGSSPAAQETSTKKPWLDILLGGPEAVGHNPEQRKAVEMTGINLLHLEIERLFGAQLVHAKFKGSHCRLLLCESSFEVVPKECLTPAGPALRMRCGCCTPGGSTHRRVQHVCRLALARRAVGDVCCSLNPP